MARRLSAPESLALALLLMPLAAPAAPGAAPAAAPKVKSPANATTPLLLPFLQALQAQGPQGQQKHLSPQLLAFFLNPLMRWYSSWTSPPPARRPGAADSDYGDYGAFPGSALSLPAAAPAAAPAANKLAQLFSMMGLGQPSAPGDVINPSYGGRLRAEGPSSAPATPAPAKTTTRKDKPAP